MVNMTISIHAEKKNGRYGRDRGTFWTSMDVTPSNNNAFTMRFEDVTELNFFNLNDVDAECLTLIGQLNAEMRAEILPALRHALEIQEAPE